ncbi:MAG: thioredoxin family protein [Smithella sp.]|nr:thioredoxin family protein [Smithella sp.]
MTLRKTFIAIVTLFTLFIFAACEQTGIEAGNAGQQTAIAVKTKSSSSAPIEKPAVKTEHATLPLATFIEIGAAQCIPCKAMQPIMKEIASEYKGQVKVVFYDVWTTQGKIDGMKYNIRVIPTQVFLDKNGKEYFRHEGYFPKEELIKVLKMQGVK